jgi:CRP-like cAMP-binding protein
MQSDLVSEPGRLFLGGTQQRTNGIAEILAGCPRFEFDAGETHFPRSFLGSKLLAVEHGLVVVRSTPEGLARSIITSEAGPGRVLLPPTPAEVVLGLTRARLVGITAEARARLFDHAGTARALVDLLELALSRRQETLANFAYTRHSERLRRKLLQLAQNYGRDLSDGIRIDFPVNHTLLAEMIGSSRETVTRALDELRRSGFVASRGHIYRLLVAPESLLSTSEA